MTFTLSFSMDTPAFDDEPASEASDILQAVATEIREGRTDGVCFDTNGNNVGSWLITE